MGCKPANFQLAVEVTNHWSSRAFTIFPFCLSKSTTSCEHFLQRENPFMMHHERVFEHETTLWERAALIIQWNFKFFSREYSDKISYFLSMYWCFYFQSNVAVRLCRKQRDIGWKYKVCGRHVKIFIWRYIMPHLIIKKTILANLKRSKHAFTCGADVIKEIIEYHSIDRLKLGTLDWLFQVQWLFLNNQFSSFKHIIVAPDQLLEASIFCSLWFCFIFGTKTFSASRDRTWAPRMKISLKNKRRRGWPP